MFEFFINVLNGVVSFQEGVYTVKKYGNFVLCIQIICSNPAMADKCLSKAQRDFFCVVGGSHFPVPA